MLFFFMSTLLILDIRRIADTCDRKSHTENASALLERFRSNFIISEHRGRLAVDPGNGIGTVATVYLPAAADLS